jgi:hypothetical protein
MGHNHKLPAWGYGSNEFKCPSGDFVERRLSWQRVVTVPGKIDR